MKSFKNKTNKKLRIDSKTYIEAGETKNLDENNRHVQMYVAIRYLLATDGSGNNRTITGIEQVPEKAVAVYVVAPVTPEIPAAVYVEESAPAVVPEVVVVEEIATPIPEPAPLIVNEEPLVIEESDETPATVISESKYGKRNKKKNNE